MYTSHIHQANIMISLRNHSDSLLISKTTSYENKPSPRAHLSCFSALSAKISVTDALLLAGRVGRVPKEEGHLETIKEVMTPMIDVWCLQVHDYDACDVNDVNVDVDDVDEIDDVDDVDDDVDVDDVHINDVDDHSSRSQPSCCATLGTGKALGSRHIGLGAEEGRSRRPPSWLQRDMAQQPCLGKSKHGPSWPSVFMIMYKYVWYDLTMLTVMVHVFMTWLDHLHLWILMACMHRMAHNYLHLFHYSSLSLERGRKTRSSTQA